MLTSLEIQHLINEFIAHIPNERSPKSLYEPIKYVLSAGGKRIRPVLMLMSYNLFKEDPESILWVASGLETYHNYTLLHDDLMDKADVRRGRPTVHKKWNENTAVLSGDSMLVLAYERIAKCRTEKLKEVLDCFTETALEIGEGQQFDMDFETRNDVTEEEYIEMIRLKTSVLLACAMKIGAILADADAEDQENLYRFGENIGLAFQLQDDFLDVYGNESVFGKSIGGDICNNKKTYMLINAINKTEGEDKEELNKWLSATNFNKEDKIKAVTEIYNKFGIDKLALRKIESYFDVATKYLSLVKVNENRKAEIKKYAEELMHRNS
jgi:geranylgeranyl diphosphate synthase type II